MRRIVVFDNVTADGYFADSKGSLDWVIPSDEVFRGAAESNQDIDTMLFGRRTYDMFERFWPHALDDPETAPDPHTAGRRSAVNREMALWINETNKIVFSRTMETTSWANTTLAYALTLSYPVPTGDGFIAGGDFDGFAVAFELGDTTADFDQDGFISGMDFDLFVQAFEAGC